MPRVRMVAMSNLPPLYDGIRTLILSARNSVVRGVDLIQVWTNFEIGRRIVEHEQHGADRAEYGKELLKELAARLTGEFGGGFSRSNLEYMRRFYLAYSDRLPQISQTLSGKLRNGDMRGRTASCSPGCSRRIRARTARSSQRTVARSIARRSSRAACPVVRLRRCDGRFPNSSPSSAH